MQRAHRLLPSAGIGHRAHCLLYVGPKACGTGWVRMPRIGDLIEPAQHRRDQLQKMSVLAAAQKFCEQKITIERLLEPGFDLLN